MDANNKVSLLISQQIPDFVQDEGPALVAFLKAYYQWMESEGQTLDVANRLLENHDIDTSVDLYIEHFKQEVMASIPESIVVDEQLLTKHIIDLYRSGGNRESYRLLFRICFNEEIDFFIPGEIMLRASDGRWVLDKSIRTVSPSSGDVTSLGGIIITGITSSATAKVERIVQTQEAGRTVNELFLSNITGTFENNELIRNGTNTINATLSGDIGPLAGITVTAGGALHQVGDIVSAIDNTGVGSGGKATVITVRDDSAVNFLIANGGNGYTTSATITVSGPGTGATFTIDAISNTSNQSVNEDLIRSVADVPLVTGPLFSSDYENIALESEDFACTSIWTASNTTIQADFFPNPNGQFTADRMTDSGIGLHSVRQTITVPGTTPGANITFSVSAKSSGRNWIGLHTAETNTNTVAFFNISTGEVGTVIDNSGSILRTDIKDEGGGWWRFSVSSRLATTGGAETFAVFTSNGDNSESYAGNTALGVRLHGADVKLHPFRSPYIKTLGAANSHPANSATLSANLAAANISSLLATSFAFANLVTGTISAITVTNRGKNYITLPSVVVDQKNISIQNILALENIGIYGLNANIVTSRAGGTISTVDVIFNNRGIGYKPIVPISLTNDTRANTDPGAGAPIISGTTEYPGFFDGTHGFLSWDHVLQDSVYYQEYSYEIQSTQSLNNYKRFIQSLLHPAGTALFGKVIIETEAVIPSLASANSEIELI